MPTCRLLPSREDDGATNMALDEALLAGAEVTTLRLYGWRQATVSLGYFQDYAGVVATLPAAHQGMPVVRRITGRGAPRRPTRQ